MGDNLKQQNIVTKRFDTRPELYANEYEKETSAGYSFRMRKCRLLEMLGVVSGRLLDIGCGPAVMTQEIIDLGWHYEGVDIAEKMIEEARKRAPTAKFRVGLVEKIDAPDGTYEAIVAMGLVEYLDDQRKALREIRRVLKERSRVFISVPNWWSPPRMWDRYIIAPLSFLIRPLTGKVYDGVLHHEYTEKEYVALLKSEGFETVGCVYYNFRLLPRPLDFWFPSLAVLTARLLEPLRFTPLRFWGTGFIIVGTKRL